ncbi:signal transduction histidine kinase/DNA-binding response OmpR family regulator [Stenotrophomonas sp. PvP093]|uniref:response regulator n=1 Tax=Stenotrophomonas TaxID=40323 RepID=UPI0007B1C2B8|nr:response regulator [Stenotrophomonas sp. PvP093]KZE46056.1 histidine kinase [Stenotrophomonas maltophilia]MBP2482689.1 signal transduction histidine kinase/DNA-binding response OmpR family regulator [Stenotrophomonas sp. PvP093]MCF3547000.1 response regulator [Stenotrophomonas maltophilia]TNX97786.1 response regulator [Stenotrophomonas maltophilia]TPD75218.1 response regulator [Stenotrophomonas maltophilia]
MRPGATTRDRWIWMTSAVLLAATIALELVVPLGYAVWLAYFLAVGVTVFQRSARAPFVVAMIACVLLVIGFNVAPASNNSSFSFVNRTIGGCAFLMIALIVSRAIQARRQAMRALWLQEAENAVASSLRGDLGPEQIAEAAATSLAGQLDAEVGAVYRLEGGRLQLTGGMALPSGAPASLALHEGLAGQVARDERIRHLHGDDAAVLELQTSLGRLPVRERILAPLSSDGAVVGIIELGRARVGEQRDLDRELLERCAETIGLALRASLLRAQLVVLLEESQRQGEELQAQQEELRVANEELEEQSRSLLQSQSHLEEQQAELEQSNVQLEERTHELEAQKQALLVAQSQLVRNSNELAATSRYKSEFLANMSHELRTPLNSSLILAKLLADNKDGTLTEEQVKYARAILSSNNDLLALINDILDLSRIEAGHVELSDEVVVVDSALQRLRETFEPMARQKGLALQIEADALAPSQLVVDSQRLQQILKNLLANAVKFTEHGKVSLHVRAAGNGRIRFEVCDTGIGIAREQLDVIFEAFRQADGSTRRRYGGTGLGLSISRDLAERMGGRIQVDSEPGRGSCFILELPLQGAPAASAAEAAEAPVGVPAPARTPAVLPPAPVRAATAAAPATASAGVADDRGRRERAGRLILAVEDDATFAEALVALAHELDFDCVVAGTAEEALTLASELRPNGILLDIGLPDVSGLSVLERLKRNPETRHIPVHVVSATDRSQVARELGAIGFAIKPTTRERLVTAIEQLEQTSQRDVRRLLIVEDDSELRSNLELLLGRDQLQIVAVGTLAGALEQLSTVTFDCMVMDLSLPDGSGYDLLEHMAGNDEVGFPPVIVYTGRALSREEEQRLRRYSKSIIIKGARSPERLLDEVTLFLHSVEASLPTDQQRLLREARRRDTVLDGRTVLLAEDDVRNIFALSSVLEPLGVTLEIARNGQEAVDRLAEREVDLVLMDIMMPEKDGLAAMREIRAQRHLQDLPIIALTAKAMPDDRERCLQAGANDYIAKPIDVDKLVSLCRVWCSRQ